MRTTNGIRSDWDVSIAEYTINKQHCDSYAFCSVTFSRDKTTPLEDNRQIPKKGLGQKNLAAENVISPVRRDSGEIVRDKTPNLFP